MGPNSTGASDEAHDFRALGRGMNLAVTLVAGDVMSNLVRMLLVVVALLASARAFADEFVQARCHHKTHHGEWRGPRRLNEASYRAFKDADAHNRHHRGHSAQVLLFARE